jgi:hypothetical protein
MHRIAPEWLGLVPNADEPWLWAVLDWVTSAPGVPLRRKKVAALLQRHRIRRLSVDDVLTVFERPGMTVAPGTIEAVMRHMQLLLPRLRTVHEQQRACLHELEAVLTELRTTEPPPPPPTGDGDHGAAAPRPAGGPSDVMILESLPGVGTIVTSGLIAEAMSLLQLRDYASLRAATGVAPVRRQTGKNKRGTVTMRYACNPRLRNACYHMARVSTQVDQTARTYYASLRKRGHSHGRALRSVADRWLRILLAMLKTRTLYDPTRFALVGGSSPADAC